MRKTGKRMALVSAILVFTMIALILFGTTSGTHSGPDSQPPTLGDWYVGSLNNVISHETVLVNGSLIINETASLELENTTLYFNTDNARIVVNGTLVMLNSTITTSAGVTGLNAFFFNTSDVTLDNSALTNLAMLKMNSSDFACEGSVLSDIQQWVVNNQTAIYNSTLGNFDLLVNATIDAYNLKVVEPASATALSNGTINFYQHLGMKAVNATGGNVSAGAYDVVDYFNIPVASGTTDVNGEAGLYILVRWMNSSGWGGLYESLVNVSVTKAVYSEYAWVRMTQDRDITIGPGNKAPVAIINAPVSNITYTDILFNATDSFDPDTGNITLYQWDFGDGMTNSTTDPVIFYAYSLPGDFKVDLTVYDEGGLSDTTTIDIHIDWVVNETVTVQDIDLELNGFVQVLSNGSLTLKNVKLAFNESFNGEHPFEVLAGGELIIMDGDSDPATANDASLITSGRFVGGQLVSVAGRGLITLHENTTFTLSNSVVDGLGWDTPNAGLIIGSIEASITDSIIRNNHIGLYFGYTGIYPKNVTISNCAINENQIGIQMHQQQSTADVDILDTNLVSNVLVGVFFHSDLGGAGSVQLQGCYISGSDQGAYFLGEGVYIVEQTQLYNNSLIGMELQGLPPGSPTLSVYLYDVSISMGDVAMDIEDTNLEAWNVSIQDTNVWDIDVFDFAYLHLYNCTFNSTKVNMPMLASLMHVYWYLNVGVYWPNGKPINDAWVDITDSGGGPISACNTSDDGWIRFVEVFHYTRRNNTDADTTYFDTHRFINASVFGRYFQETDVFVNSTMDVLLTLTDSDDPQGSITIDNGSQITNSFTVSLALTYSDVGSGVDAIAVSNTLFNSTNAVWETPQNTRLWGLESIQGNHTIYYKVRDVSGAESPVYTDTIDADTVQPASYVKSLAQYRKTGIFTLEWGPKVGVTDISSYTIQYSFDGEFWFDDGTYMSETSTTWQDGEEGDTIYFRSIARDVAGNIEVKTIHDTHTTIDSIAPQSAILPIDLYQTKLNVTLIWTGYDRTSDVEHYTIQYKRDESSTEWQVLASDVTGDDGEFTMPGQGDFYLRTLGIDTAGNTEVKPGGLYDVEIHVDTVPPKILPPGIQVEYSDSDATISWETSEMTKGTVSFGTDPDNLQIKTDYMDSTSHSVYLYDLTQNTEYFYKVTAIDQAGNVFVDDNGKILYKFTTDASYGFIEGIVTDSVTEDPVENAGIYLNGIFKGLTNSTGGFRYQVPAGSYQLMAAHLLYETYVLPLNVNILAGQTTYQNAEITKSSKEEGAITLDVLHDGDPVTDAYIQILLDSTTIVVGYTDGNGAYQIALGPGNYTIIVTKPGYVKYEGFSQVRIGEVTPLEVELEKLPEQEETPWILRTKNLSMIIIIVVTVIIIALFVVFLLRDRIMPGKFKFLQRRKKRDHDEEEEEDDDGVVECPSCDTLVGKGETRCPECGESLYEVISDDEEVLEEDLEFDCPFCGDEIDPEDSHCTECGLEIPEEYKDEYYEKLELIESGGKVKKRPEPDEEEEEDEEDEEEEYIEEEEEEAEEEDLEEEEEEEEELVDDDEEPEEDDYEEEEPDIVEDDDQEPDDEEEREFDEELDDDDLEDIDLEDWEEEIEEEENSSSEDNSKKGSKKKGKDIEVVML
jgi:hypothetical protein